MLNKTKYFRLRLSSKEDSREKESFKIPETWERKIKI